MHHFLCLAYSVPVGVGLGIYAMGRAELHEVQILPTMQLLKSIPLLSLASGALAARIQIRDDGEHVAEQDIIKQFIVEVKADVDVEAVSEAIVADTGAKVLRTFNSDIFKGFTVESDEHNIDSLNQVTEVEQAWPATLIELPPNEVTVAFDDIKNTGNYSIHQWTGVDKAHAAGIYGAGVKVAVVDTGIDYNHPALGGGFGPGFKVSGGYDLVGSNYPSSAPEPDEDPMDERGHGTHVAGIIGAKNEWFTGVAPDAELLAYKVFSSQAGVWDTELIAAFLLAYEDGADIITSSIGAHNGWSNGPWALVASRLVDQGVVVTIAASNEGSIGTFYANSGSSGKNVLAIASAEASTFSAKPFELTYTLNGRVKKQEAGYRYNFYEWDVVDKQIIPLFLDTGVENQACTPNDIPANTPDLSTYITLVRRSLNCDILAQEFNLRAFNVSHIMFYSDLHRPDDPSSWLSGPKAVVDQQVGETIIDTVKAGGKVTGDFVKLSKADWYAGVYNGVGNRPSEFTSWGALFDLDLKPDVSAPGGDILSTYPGNTWRVSSGTSMATPYAAGVAALWLGKFGTRNTRGNGVAKLFNNRVVGSGAAMPWNTVDAFQVADNGFWAPTIQAGSGLLNAWRVLNYTSTLSTTKFNLNDTAHFKASQSVDITNPGKTEVEYRFELQPAGGVEAGAVGKPLSLLSAIKPISMVPKVQFPTGTFKIAAGQTKKASFIFDYPRGLNVSNQPLYSGKILITSSLGELLSVPYFGAAYDLKQAYQDIYLGSPTIRFTSGSSNITNKQSWNFQGQDYPRLSLALLFGCDELRWDIYQSGWTESKWKYPPVVGQNNYVGSATTWREAGRYSFFDPNKNDKEDTIAFPIRAIRRSILISDFLGWVQNDYFWLGKLADGTYIKPGTYKMRVAALRPFGDRTKPADWDIYETPEIKILAAK
ncbi:Minor extracellular protease vpr [Paramyrothecium foliicola]|nr:Minor extracellular protease vpr [Paramyrothecium foliicola]